MAEFNDFIEAVNMAIDALEKMPSAEPEPMCINLNESIKVKLTDWGKPIGDGRPLADSEIAIERAIEVLEELPSASTEFSTFSDRLWKIAYERGKAEPRKKGKWLRSGSTIFPCECDQCGDTTERNTPFCPHCGADMTGGEEE